VFLGGDSEASLVVVPLQLGPGIASHLVVQPHVLLLLLLLLLPLLVVSGACSPQC
jgi:hypothetical protein